MSLCPSCLCGESHSPQRHKEHKGGLLNGGCDRCRLIALEIGNYFALGARLQQLPSGTLSQSPDLGKKILLAVAVEHELGFFRGSSGRLGNGHDYSGVAIIVALNEHPSGLQDTDGVVPGRERDIARDKLERNVRMEFKIS